MKRSMSSLGFGTLMVMSSIACASANAIPTVRAVAPHAASPAATAPVGAPGAQHRLFGALVSVNGALLTIKLRNGRLLQVNAAQAFALNRVSAPFYRGKPTVVTGTFGSGGVFEATAVKRAAPHSVDWDLDR